MLAELLTSKTRAEVMRILFNGRKEEYYLREIERLSSMSIHSIQKEMKHLCSIDLVKSRKDGNRVYFKINKEHPLYGELASIVEKTVGAVGLLKERLKDSRVECSFIFGSFAMEKEKADSDIDLLVIGSLKMRALTKLLSGVQEKVGREINPHIFSKEEFETRIKQKDHFVTSVLKKEIKPITGHIDDYR
ncbi:MAG: nucleotidyltransferase domain-containing protein [Bacteriovoracaceae bacterium]|nr:nucleotidyltransferase domain-containing protein [Bacteriovoracaceae bacterium]